MKKYLSIILFLVSISSFQSQTITKYTSGSVFWGAFNADKQKIEGNLDYRGKVTHIEKSSDVTRTYYYLIVGLDKDGKTFKLNLYGEVNKPESFFDDDQLQYMVLEEGNQLNILCFKPLPTTGKNLFLYISIVDLY